MVVAYDRVVVGALMHLCIHISAVFVLETNRKTTTSSTLVVVVFVVIGAPELQHAPRHRRRGKVGKRKRWA